MNKNTVLRAFVAIVAPLAAALSAHAQGSFLESDGPRHRVGIGSWAYATENDARDNTIDTLDLRRVGATLSYSYSFFRPTRHEATVQVQGFLRSERQGLGAAGEAAASEQLARVLRRDMAIVSSEYRWRFGGYGQAWYGMGLGVASTGNRAFGVGVGSLGYDVSNQWFVEFRSYSDDKEGMLGTFSVGVRF